MTVDTGYYTVLNIKVYMKAKFIGGFMEANTTFIYLWDDSTAASVLARQCNNFFNGRCLIDNGDCVGLCNKYESQI